MLRGRRCCEGGGAARTRRKGCGWERGSDLMVREAKGFQTRERPKEDSGWAGPRIWNEGIKEIGQEVGKRAVFPISGYKERHHFLPVCVEASFRNAAVWRPDRRREKPLTFTCSSCITAARWRRKVTVLNRRVISFLSSLQTLLQSRVC